MANNIEQSGEQNSTVEYLARVLTVVGTTAIAGAVGYAAAKGVEAIIPVEPNEVFEATVVAGSALLGSFVATETLS
jgi:hypothetical protein